MHILSSLNSHRMRITFPVCKGYKIELENQIPMYLCPDAVDAFQDLEVPGYYENLITYCKVIYFISNMFASTPNVTTNAECTKHTFNGTYSYL